MTGRDSNTDDFERAEDLPAFDWDEILEPGCYLHVSTGLLARVYPESLETRPHAAHPGRENRMIRLSRDPETSLAALRILAARYGYPVCF